MDWGRYPVLVAALAAISVGTGLLVSDGGRDFAAFVLILLGAVLMGVWIERD